ncbi:alpha/beta hydrolase [Paenibacillus radicis (ex Xue et al. 2023)]|uniref:Lysophospholipase n=1 Tax=Paenibacillus radicis (ex Xue et al. 2023) TaxID=2972489 RepID=A0ABT1YVA8_9BACL|nr:lysophospholipase [Paenibacillus radicis (ex Xue et al. 2023)]MCR8636862.1 lysophospholipase [Paenibacillus radicis (ex Xue et al. 2023)]
MRPTPAITRAARPRGARSKKLLWTFVLLLLVLAVASVTISTYVGWKLTHPEHKALTDSPDKYGLSFEPVEFESRNKDVKLKGWFIPASDTSTPAKMNIIFAHGYRENRLQSGAEALKLAKELAAQGYNVLMFDFRNSGESEGNLTTVGYLEKFDLLGAIDWTRAHHPEPIALHGFSMGGTVALLAAAEDPQIAGVVADSPFNHLTRYLEDNLPVWSKLPNYPFTPLILGILPPLTGIVTDQVDGLTAVDRIYPRPVLFIHSAEDASIPYQNSESMWEKHKDRFQIWKPSAGREHVRVHAKLAAEYESKVLEFYKSLQR